MKIYRYGIQDIVLTEKEAEKLASKYCVEITGKDGKVIAVSELYFVEEETDEWSVK